MSILSFLFDKFIITSRLEEDIKNLSYVYPVALDENYLIVEDFDLPPGYNYNTVPVLLKLPPDYPESPPGVGNSAVYVPMGLRFKGRKPKDCHEDKGPNKEWAWWCYESIKWDICRDDFITFFELLRAHMTNPM